MSAWMTAAGIVCPTSSTRNRKENSMQELLSTWSLAGAAVTFVAGLWIGNISGVKRGILKAYAMQKEKETQDLWRAVLNRVGG
jgi:hypothetical protein